MGTTLATTLPRLLNDAETALNDRTFASDEVKQQYAQFLSTFSAKINDQMQDHFDAMRFIVFPFKTNSDPSVFQSDHFLSSFLDSLSLIAFSDFNFSIEQNYLNIKINDMNIFGLYYARHSSNLQESMYRLLESFKDKSNVPLPTNFVFMILGCIGSLEPLEQEKIQNIVTDILGENSIIKPLDLGAPQCIPITSYIIQECGNLDEARDFVRGVLNL